MPAEVLPDFLGGTARGCIRVHPALRAGFTPIDGERIATLAMGCAAHATATLPAASAAPARAAAASAAPAAAAASLGAAALGPLRVRALLYSGYPCEVAPEAQP